MAGAEQPRLLSLSPMEITEDMLSQITDEDAEAYLEHRSRVFAAEFGISDLGRHLREQVIRIEEEDETEEQ